MNDFDALLLANLAVTGLAAALAIRGNAGFYLRRRPAPRKGEK